VYTLFDVPFCVVRPHHSTTYVDAVYRYGPSSVVCRSGTLVSPAKMAEPIEMQFELRTLVGPGNHVLDGGPDPPWEGAILRRGRASHCKVYRQSAVICAKTAEPIEMPFGLRARMGQRNRVLHGAQIPHGKGQFWGKGRPL